MSELNQKHPSTKFDYKFDCKQIKFLDTLVYIDQQNNLQTILFQKSSECQNLLNAKSEHPSQAFWIQWICSTFQKYHRCGHTANSEGWQTWSKTSAPSTKTLW